jgi:hypothetical protein
LNAPTPKSRLLTNGNQSRQNATQIAIGLDAQNNHGLGIEMGFKGSLPEPHFCVVTYFATTIVESAGTLTLIVFLSTESALFDAVEPLM